ncbi:DUF3043 domain-containing protein [Corynebacterium incognita]|uniref:DUF3043 domain-containing protein n=1 Tax=Corynebacterium incognita TaxID=2754725 RepID=A0A7G7CS91_9CORY|nr:DUF3043 domain-containing protein [Corynebacterium incognita]QNE90457.1 DUF3043 domain-containing protein [Corynebacterium incognita]
MEENKSYPKGYTPPKGRPTPKRVEQEIARGVRRDPHGMTDAQRRQNRKELKASMSKQEWKEYKKKERAERQAETKRAQERMAAGDERYLMERDRGEERRYVRDWVDSKRFLNEWIMPMLLVMLLCMFIGIYSPQVSTVATLLGVVVIVVFGAEGVIIGRRANKAVLEKFPNSTEPGFGLGMYAYSRANQPRKWRTPKPRVAVGDTV